MFSKLRELPLWMKGAAAALVLFLLLFSGYKGYQMYQDRRVPVPEPVPAPQPPVPKPLPEPVPPRPSEPLPPPVPEDVRAKDLWLRVVKSSYRMYLYRGKNLEATFPVAIGLNGGQKQRVGDSRTPTGSFTVQQIQNARSWTYDFGDGKGPTPGAYGPWFIRLKTPGWSGIGIHGTHAPDSIGTMITQGCVRMHNTDLEKLKRLVYPGMKVIISE